MFQRCLLVLLLVLPNLCLCAQDSTGLDRLAALPSQLLSGARHKTDKLSSKLDQQTSKYLTRLERKEKKLYRRMYRKDSALARHTFGNIDSSYAALRDVANVGTAKVSQYIGHLDSLSTATAFLTRQFPGSAGPLQQNLQQYAGLQQRFNASEEIRKRLTERRKLITQQFEKLGMVKQLRGLQKDVYYYSAQIKEYKALLKDPSKWEQQLMDLAMKVPAFKDFFRRNSALGRMFALPGGSSSGAGGLASIQGLQTRASVNALIASRFGTAATAQLQQNVQAAQGQMASLQAQLARFGSGSMGNGNADMPKDFRPNTQKTKGFGKRLEWGANMQSQRARYYFPVTSDIGLSLGYKVNDNSVIGVGMSCKLGLGSGWKHLVLTHEGIGLRSYVDVKLKGALYVSGGYERNHFSAFKTIPQLKDANAWQQSGLIGLSKGYSVSKKVKGEMKLLWDFLSYQQLPRTQAIVFRVGYRLK